MTTKEATKIADGLALGLNDAQLLKHDDLILLDEKAFSLVVNAYRQRKAADAPLPKATGKAKAKAKAAPAKPAAKAAPAKPTAKATPKPAAKAPAKPAGKSRTTRMFELVLEGKTNEAALAVIKKEYASDLKTDEKQTTTASIGWCRSQLMNKSDYGKKHNPKGLKVLTNKEAADKSSK